MKKKNQELRKHIEKYYVMVSSLEIDYFFRLIGDLIFPYVIYEEDIWFPINYISKLIGKDMRDYSANWINNDRRLILKGVDIQFGDKSPIVSKALQDKFPEERKQIKVKPNIWFVNWERLHDYICRSSYAFTKTKKANPEMTKVFIEDGILYISSYEIAERLKIQHNSLVQLIYKYEEKIQGFGLLIKKYEANIKQYKNRLTPYNTAFYMLNEDQAYLIATLARNSENAIDFKCWLVSQFSKARFLKSGGEIAADTEDVIHSQLAQLGLYSSIPIQTEFPLPLEVKRGSKTVKVIKRIDLLIDKKVAIELKNETITPFILNDIIGNRGYFHTLSKIPSFKYLIISSPHGVSPEARNMIDLMHPKVIFKYPHEIGDGLASRILKEYPQESHWWLKKFVLSKFNKVLSPSFIQALLNSPDCDTKS